MVVVQCIKETLLGCASGLQLVQAICRMILVMGSVTIMHVYREANQYPNALANLACDMDSDVMSFEHAPAMLKRLLSFHVRGIP